MDPATITSVMGALGWGVYVPVVLAGIGFTAHLAAVLPPVSPAAPRWWRVARRALDLVAGNYGTAANRPVAPSAKATV